MAIPDDRHSLNPTNFDPDFATVAQWAAMYRACGFQVVPCKDKRPALHEWKEFQNELIAQSLFDVWYGAGGKFQALGNMGVITGPCSGNLFVIDLDLHKTPQAASWWRAVMAEENSGLDLETPEQRTGGGGIQKLFRAPNGVVIPTIRTDKGVDIRGTGGFAVLPPTLHQSGQNYAWLPLAGPWERAVAMAEPWLIDAVCSLAEAHSGEAAAAQMRTPSPGSDYTAFGLRQDGREEEMYRAVWRAVLELYRAAPIKPSDASSVTACEEAYLLYETRVVSRLGGVDKEAGLEQEGRGRTAFRRKWAREMRLWGSPKMVREAAKPAPEGTNPASPGGPQSYPSQGGPVIPPISGPIAVRSAFPIVASDIPVRNWVVPGLLLRGSLSVLVAPPGSGKSLLTLQMAVAVAAGVPWGGFVPRTRQKVLVINAEDDFDEMRRRLAVAATEMGVTQADLVGWLDLAEDPQSIVICKIDSRSKAVIRMPLVDSLIATIQAGAYGLVVADPFAETFQGDENSNSEVKWAGVLWREVARQAACALWLVHHTKKYASAMAGDADASRGGGAMIGVARVMVTLFNMTEDEAEVMSVDPEKRTDYVRLDDAKGNYSRKGSVRWFEKATREVGNATAFLPTDEVGVLIPWKPAGPLDGVSIADINMALDVIDRGVLDKDGKPTGGYYSAKARSNRWCGKVLAEHLDASDDAIKGLIKTWLESGTLEIFEYLDPRHRKPVEGVRSALHKRPGSSTTDTL